MSKSVGKSVTRVDAYEKATGRAKYVADLCDRSALVARILHSTIAHGYVKAIDTAGGGGHPRCGEGPDLLRCAQLSLPHGGTPLVHGPGPPGRGGPAAAEPPCAVLRRRHRRRHRRGRGGRRPGRPGPESGVRGAALRPGCPESHGAGRPPDPRGLPRQRVEAHGHPQGATISRPSKSRGLIKVEGWYDTPTVQHCHIENHGCFAYEEAGRVVVVTSTQIPHIIRRVVGQALGLPWGKVRIIKPLHRRRLRQQAGRAVRAPVRLALHPGGRPAGAPGVLPGGDLRLQPGPPCHRTHIISWVRPDGTLAARKFEAWSNQGGYASHGHSIVAKGMGAFPQLYPCDNLECDCWTVYTNRPAAGAMRGYGIPQAIVGRGVPHRRHL